MTKNNVHNKTLKVNVEWDTDDSCYHEGLPTRFTFKESDLGLDNEEYTQDELKDVLEEHLWGNYCGTQDIWCDGVML